MANDIHALRGHLFSALEALKARKIDPEEAKAVSEVSRTVIDTVRVEIEYMRQVGESVQTGFVGQPVLEAPKEIKPKAVSNDRVPYVVGVP